MAGKKNPLAPPERNPVPELEPQRDPLEQQVRSVVDQWYVDNMHNTVVSRDTDVHNLIHEAKPALVQAVLAAVRQSVPNQE